MSNVLEFRRPRPAPPKPDAPRLVRLSRPLLDMAVALERDPLMAEMATGDGFAVRALAVPDLAVACLRGGYLVAAGGLIPHWPGRAEAWALVSVNSSPRDVTAAVRLARRWLDDRQRNPMFRRIECFVRSAAAWRRSFMHGLGFEFETDLTGWGPDGSDFAIFARVTER